MPNARMTFKLCKTFYKAVLLQEFSGFHAVTFNGYVIKFLKTSLIVASHDVLRKKNLLIMKTFFSETAKEQQTYYVRWFY